MCFNIVVYGLVNKSMLLNVIKTEQKSNNHGYFFKNKRSEVRTLNFNEFLETIDKNVRDGERDFIHLHLRQRTSGAISIENVHGWSSNGWYFSHNGGVVLYNIYNKNANVFNEKSDSREFFEEIKKRIENIELIREKVEELLFSGVGFITNHEKQQLIIISRNKSVKLYILNNTTIFANDPIDYVLPSTKKTVFNVTLEKQNYYKAELRNTIAKIDLKRKKILEKVYFNDKKHAIYPRWYYDD